MNSWQLSALADMPLKTDITSGKLWHRTIAAECFLTSVTPTRNRILLPSRNKQSQTRNTVYTQSPTHTASFTFHWHFRESHTCNTVRTPAYTLCWFHFPFPFRQSQARNTVYTQTLTASFTFHSITGNPRHITLSTQINPMQQRL